MNKVRHDTFTTPTYHSIFKSDNFTLQSETRGTTSHILQRTKYKTMLPCVAKHQTPSTSRSQNICLGGTILGAIQERGIGLLISCSKQTGNLHFCKAHGQILSDRGRLATGFARNETGLYSGDIGETPCILWRIQRELVIQQELHPKHNFKTKS